MNDEMNRDRSSPRREVEEQAIRAALSGRWKEADSLNRVLLQWDPNDVEALNRLGKALMELQRYEEAYASYSRALELDPYNRISRKNQERLSSLLTAERRSEKPEGEGREQFLPDLFISESGKSAVVPLRLLADPQVLQQLSRGEIVRLEAAGQTVLVKTDQDVVLGRLDPRVGHRLAEFIQAGNRYAAAIAEASESAVKVFVRETHQHPRMASRASFPPVSFAPTEIVRPYIRDLSLRLEEAAEEEDLEEEEEEEEEEELEDEADIDEEEEELLEDDFDDDTLDEDL